MHNILEILLPRRCAVCGTKLLIPEEHLCTACSMKMPLTYFWTMEHNLMSDKLNLKIQNKREAAGLTGYEPYSHAAALYFYLEDYRLISRKLKYNAAVKLGAHISSVLGRKLSHSPYPGHVDVIIPVPLHWTRRLRRGYNQAEVVARGVSARMDGSVVNSGILQRTRRTRSQAHTSVKEKSANVQGAFSVNLENLARALDGGAKHFLIVDDVFTTGSTLSECHVALRSALCTLIGRQKASEMEISVATLAYVGE